MKSKLIMLLTFVLALSLVSPAMGGPSISGIGKIAKKALKSSKQAQRTANASERVANAARQTAGTAIDTANSANGNATNALAQAGLVKTSTVSQEVVAQPGDFAHFDVRCPAGYVAAGDGVGNGALDPVFTGPVGNGYIGSMSNLTGSQPFSGILYVVCAKGAFSATAARLPRSKAYGLMRAAERAAR